MKREDIIIAFLGVIAIISMIMMFAISEIAKDQAQIIAGYQRDC